MMSAELIAAAVKLIGVLALIVGGLLAFNVYSRRFFKTGARGGGRALRVLESTPVGLKKSVTLIQVPGAVLVVGITNERITLLDRIESRDYDALIETPSSPSTPSFHDQLRKMTGGWQRKPFDTDSARPADAPSC